MQPDRMSLTLTFYQQGSERIMTQVVLSFQYEEEKLGRLHAIRSVLSLVASVIYLVWFEGNYSEYEADRKTRLGAAVDQPHRIRYRHLTRR